MGNFNLMFRNSDDQADMCELIRSLIGGGVYEGVKFDDLKEIMFDSIECPGEENDSNYNTI